MKNINIIKKQIMLLIMASVVFILAFSSCNSDNNIIRIVPTDSIVSLDIATVRSFYHGENVRIDKNNNFKQINIFGSLISDPETGNTPEGYLILQEENDGIALLLKDSVNQSDYELNDILQVNIKNGTLQKIDGNLVITGLSKSDITRTGEVDSILPTTVSLKTLVNNFDQYNETVVKLQLVNLVPTPLPGDVYGGTWGLDDGTTDPGLINLYTFPHSKLDNQMINTNSSLLTLVGMVMYNKGEKDSLKKQIWLRNEIENKESDVIPSKSPFVITGFLANPTGWDQIQPGVGYFPSYLDRPVEGGFQYVQFMALKDIDFSKTPFSMVLMLSTEGRPGATADGWTAGTFRTIKFDLTSGTAAQGTFFYVGSGEKLIDGFSPDGFSTDISNANWIRSTPWLIHSTPAGWDDEIGEPFSNGNIGHGANSWIDHRTEAGSDAIAVFEGTDVTPTSVPVDAVFFNENIGGTLDESNGYGFLVPDNDLYNSVNPNTNTTQPLFGEGSNTYAVPISIVSGDGVWVALGGVVSGKGFIEKRNNPTGIQLSVEPGQSHLSDIEEGPGITIFRK